MRELLASHALSPKLLLKDAFDALLEDRRRKLSDLVESAMGKPVSRITESVEGRYGDE